MDANERMLSVDSAGNGEDDEFRRYHYINVPCNRDDSLNTSIYKHIDSKSFFYCRCSIGSASSLQEREDNGNNVNSGEAGSDHMDRLGLGDLGIRRVSDISHINEIRREVNQN